jgi:hypothetical protein
MSACMPNYKIDEQKNTICGRWHRKIVNDLILDKDIEYVVLSYRTEKYLINDRNRKALVSIANDLSEAGKKVILVLQAPMPMAHINKYLAKNISDLSGSISSRKLYDWKIMYSETSDILKLLNPNVEIFDPTNLFCDSEYCYVVRNGIALFFDDNHMSVSGGNLIAEDLFKKFFTSL